MDFYVVDLEDYLSLEQIEFFKENIGRKRLRKTLNIFNAFELDNAVRILQSVNSIYDYSDELLIHSIKTALYCLILNNYYNENDVQLFYSALLHDIGKTGIPKEILFKKEKLTGLEFQLIGTHSYLGECILSDNGVDLQYILEGARNHHIPYSDKERYNVSFMTEIIAVADSFDAMNSKRCYKEKYELSKIIDEFQNNKYTQFNPSIADTVINLIKLSKLL